MIDERTSAWVSRAEVRSKIDEDLDKIGRVLSRGGDDHPPSAEEIAAEREARENDPRQEHAAASLMALASGARRKG